MMKKTPQFLKTCCRYMALFSGFFIIANGIVFIIQGVNRWDVFHLVTVIGYILGGPLGVGTVLFAFMVGWFMEVGFSLINLVRRSGFYRSLWQGLQEQGEC